MPDMMYALALTTNYDVKLIKVVTNLVATVVFLLTLLTYVLTVVFS